MLEGIDIRQTSWHFGKGVNLPLSSPENETRSGLDKVPVAPLTNTF